LIVGEGESTGQKTCDDLQARWQTIQRVEICAKKVAARRRFMISGDHQPYKSEPFELDQQN
jgi:hypothetical protein